MTPDQLWMRDGILLVAALILCRYGFVTWLVYITERVRADTDNLLFDEEKNPPPVEVAGYVRAIGGVLSGLGFQPYPPITASNPAPHIWATAYLWMHPLQKDTAVILTFNGATRETAALRPSVIVEFASRFISGACHRIRTSNSAVLDNYPNRSGHFYSQFPGETDISRLYELHQKLIRLYAANEPKTMLLFDEFGGDFQKYAHHVAVDGHREQERTGYLQFDREQNAWRPTLKGALLVTIKSLWPISSVRRLWFRWSFRSLKRNLRIGKSSDSDGT
jgi:hypothetical protein